MHLNKYNLSIQCCIEVGLQDLKLHMHLKQEEETFASILRKINAFNVYTSKLHRIKFARLKSAN